MQGRVPERRELLRRDFQRFSFHLSTDPYRSVRKLPEGRERTKGANFQKSLRTRTRVESLVI